MGDHRSGSKDSVTINRPVTYDNITGVLLSIEGTAEYYVHYVCSKCGHEVNEKEYVMGQITACDKCGGLIKPDCSLSFLMYLKNVCFGTSKSLKSSLILLSITVL